MNNLLTVLSFLFLSATSFAQAPDYDDLKIIYADANYEKLIKIAASYTEKDKTKKDPIPYLWCAKGLYQVSLSGTDNEKFKNAFKDAIKYLSKGIKYDQKYNEGSNLEDHKDFIDEFQWSLFETIDNELSDGNYKKSYGLTIKYQKVSLQTVGAKYLMGACKYMDQDKTTARTLWLEADAILKTTVSLEGWSEADVKMLKAGLLTSALALKKSRQGEKAKALLNKSAHWFEEDSEWQEKYDQIVH
tara:strand:+ start:4301 stop:5035 length:735 start_codon:yes stop_codon:yes gene_type:complete